MGSFAITSPAGISRLMQRAAFRSTAPNSDGRHRTARSRKAWQFDPEESGTAKISGVAAEVVLTAATSCSECACHVWHDGTIAGTLSNVICFASLIFIVYLHAGVFAAAFCSVALCELHGCAYSI